MEKVRTLEDGRTRRADYGGDTLNDRHTVRTGGVKLATVDTPPPWKRWRARIDRRVIQFIERYVVVPNGYGAGEPMKVYPWQRALLADLWDDSTRALMTSVPRGNGKTTFPAAVGLAVLHLSGTVPHVPVLSVTEQRSRELIDLAVQMVDASPELRSRTHFYGSRGELRVPATNGRMWPLGARPSSAQGLVPELGLIDEIGFVDADLFATLLGALGKRPRARVWAMGTPGFDTAGTLWHYKQLSDAGELPPAFLFREWAADPSLPITSREAWLQANPMLAEGVMDAASLDMLARGGMTEADFRRFRLGQHVSDDLAPFDVTGWRDLTHTHVLEDGTPLAVAFVGSQGDNCTAIVAAELDTNRTHVLAVWVRPEDRPGWKAPRAEIDAELEAIMGRFEVHTLRVHPSGWHSELERWIQQWGPHTVAPWSVSRRAIMGPASDRLLRAVDAGGVTHDGHADLESAAIGARSELTADGPMLRADEKRDLHRTRVEPLLALVAAFDAAREAEYTSGGQLIH